MTSTPSGPISPKQDYQSMVDTSRPFRSVKEAVGVFGERILVGTKKQKEERSLKKVEAELEEARAELEEARAEVKVLKERVEKREEDGISNKKNGRELISRKRVEKNTTLAHILSLVDHEYEDDDVNVNVTNKVKPIVPLVGDYLFAMWKKKPTLFSS